MYRLLLLCLCLACAACADRVFPTQQLSERRTELKCSGSGWEDTRCRARYALLINDTLHFVADGPLQLPKLKTNCFQRIPFDASNYRVLSPEALRKLLQAARGTLSEERFPYGVLMGAVFSKWPMYTNWFHNMVESGGHLHQSMCSEFGLCDYEQQQLRSALILLDTPPGKETVPEHHWHEGVKCFSAQPTRYVGRKRPAPKYHGTRVTWLDNVLIGAGYIETDLVSREMHGDMPRDPGQRRQYYKKYGAHMQQYRRRWFRCLGLPTEDPPMETPKPFTVTFVQRFATGSRSLLNLQEVVYAMQQDHAFSGVRFNVVTPEHVSLRDMARQYYRTNVFVFVHGAAMGHVLFLPNRSSIVEVLPWSQRHTVKRSWLGRFCKGLNAGLFKPQCFHYGVPHRQDVVLNIPRMTRSLAWANLTDHEKVKVLVEQSCPVAHSQCAAYWLFRDVVGMTLHTHFKRYLQGVIKVAQPWARGERVAMPRGVELHPLV